MKILITVLLLAVAARVCEAQLEQTDRPGGGTAQWFTMKGLNASAGPKPQGQELWCDQNGSNYVRFLFLTRLLFSCAEPYSHI